MDKKKYYGRCEVDTARTIDKSEEALLEGFKSEMERLLSLNTHKGPIVVDGEECAYQYIHFKIAQHLLALCEHSFMRGSGIAMGTRQTEAVKKACVDIANLAFIYQVNLRAGKQ